MPTLDEILERLTHDYAMRGVGMKLAAIDHATRSIRKAIDQVKPDIVETPSGSLICQHCGVYVASKRSPDCRCVTVPLQQLKRDLGMEADSSL